MSEWKINCPHCEGLIGIKYDAESKTTVIRPLEDPPPVNLDPPAPVVAGQNDTGILDNIFAEGKIDVPAKEKTD